MHRAPIGEHDLQARHVVRCDAILEAVRPAGVDRDVAAHRRRTTAGRIRWEVEPLSLDHLIECQVDYARLHHGAASGNIQLQQVLHMRELQDQAFSQRHGATREPRPRAARHDRHVVRPRPTHRSLQVTRAVGEEDPHRRGLVDATVHPVRQQLHRVVDDLARIQLLLERRQRPLAVAPQPPCLPLQPPLGQPRLPEKRLWMPHRCLQGRQCACLPFRHRIR